MYRDVQLAGRGGLLHAPSKQQDSLEAYNEIPAFDGLSVICFVSVAAKYEMNDDLHVILGC